MVKKAKKALSLLISAMMVFGLTIIPAYAADGVTATGSQKAYVVGDDWGPGVSKTIITLDKTVDPESVQPSDFNVFQGLNGSYSDRTIEDAYVSDANGNKVNEASNIVTIQMAINPGEGNPIVWNGQTWRNNWANPYELNVSLVEGATLTAGDEVITTLDVESVIDVAGDGKICPQLDGFDMDTYTYGDATLSYALYAPKEDNHTNALVIWNHGIGETGTDVQIDLLGNKVTALADDEFQAAMDGAYILVPQRSDGNDVYEAIYQLANKVLAENSDIDPNKVIVGGCSAGGATTMQLLFAHPEFYAAAYPICPATTSASVSDEMIESIKDVPIWFIHALNDTTCNPQTNSIPLASRLKAAGADVHESYFKDVHDTTGRFFDDDEGNLSLVDTGKPYQYDGHWSWTYFYNNECVDENGINLWQWMSVQTKLDDNVATGNQKAYIIGDDWGPAVSKTIISLDKIVDPDSLDVNDFSVSEDKLTTVDWETGKLGMVNTDRVIEAIYTSDASGNKVETPSNYVTIEMYVDPNTGSPFVYNPSSGFNSWCTDYNLIVTLNESAEVTSEGKAITAFDIEANIDVAGDEKIVPQVDGIFDLDNKYTASDGTLYNYATYTPESDNKQNALVIWLHGAGEGTNNGVNDSYIDLLGNEVTAFASDEFQSEFDGAYVLVPQAPTMWMDGGNGVYQNGDLGSIYTESLMEFIETFVATHPDVDPNRIIIGGCSNGGYMTMEMILTYPDYFAAAFPICEAFQDQYITDAQIEAIKDMPIWFTYAKNDTTVDPTLCTELTYDRLIAAGATNVHLSAFADVRDTTGRFFNEDGSEYQYAGHWSWIYFDNNECFDENGVNAWHWLGQQYKSASSVDNPTDVNKPSTGSGSTSTAVKTGDDVALLGLGILMALSATTYTVARKRYH